MLGFAIELQFDPWAAQAVVRSPGISNYLLGRENVGRNIETFVLASSSYVNSLIPAVGRYSGHYVILSGSIRQSYDGLLFF